MKEPPYDDDFRSEMALLVWALVFVLLFGITMTHVAINELGPPPSSTLVPLEPIETN